MAIEPVWRFYPKLFWQDLVKHSRMVKHWLSIQMMLRSVRNDPARRAYTDQALAEIADDEADTFELFTHNEGARQEVVRTRRIAELTHGPRAPAEVA
jgi:hypothetical protein